MIPDISELPWWAMLIITFASACAGYIIVIIFVRNEATKKKNKLKTEKGVEQAKKNVTNARQKFEKLLNDYPTYYFTAEKLKELKEINIEILSCKVVNSDEYYALKKKYTEVYFTSFKVLAKYDLELIRTIERYIDAVDDLVRNKDVPKGAKQSVVSILVPYLNALDILMPKSFRWGMPIHTYIGIE